MDAAVLTCRDLTRSFGALKAVDGVSFSVAPGETYGLLGPNGAGKTTIISMIAGLLEPDGGEIQVAGRVMTPSAKDAKAAVGLVPQDLAIYPDLTGRENLEFFARLYGIDRDARRNRIGEVLAVTGLTDRANDRSSTYSGGMKRRLNIGIGLLHRPLLLILDEPTVGVDPQSRNAIMSAIEILADDGISVLYTTHYMEEAERLCDRIGIIDQGRVVAEGSRRQLIAMVGENDLVRLSVSSDALRAAKACRDVPGVESADVDDGVVVCLMENAAERLAAMLAAVTSAGVSITGVNVREPDLEDLFLHVTGKALRE
ncbi:MAG: ABC transporter ATP-binding protein [Nitriliruptoraceae bacterium]